MMRRSSCCNPWRLAWQFWKFLWHRMRDFSDSCYKGRIVVTCQRPWELRPKSLVGCQRKRELLWRALATEKGLMQLIFFAPSTMKKSVNSSKEGGGFNPEQFTRAQKLDGQFHCGWHGGAIFFPGHFLRGAFCAGWQDCETQPSDLHSWCPTDFFPRFEELTSSAFILYCSDKSNWSAAWKPMPHRCIGRFEILFAPGHEPWTRATSK